MLKAICLSSAILLSFLHPRPVKKATSNWYVFIGIQTVYDRKLATNYLLLPYAPDCMGNGDECSVMLNQSSLVPNFNYITFDANGLPNGNKPGHTDFVLNEQKD